MATDLEKLVISLEANLKSYENSFAKAAGITRTQLREIKRDAGEIGTAAENGFRRFGKAAESSQRNVLQFRTGLQQLGLQAQDVAVQLSAGTSALTVFGQQAPQILSVFGPLGIAIGAAAAALPLLAAAFGSAGSEAEKFNAVAESLSETLSNLKQAGFEVTEATELFSASLQTLAEVGATSAIDGMRQEIKRLTDDVRQVSALLGAGMVRTETISGVDILREKLGLTSEQAKLLHEALVALANAPMDQLASASQNVLNTIANIASETGEITPEMQAVADMAAAAGQAAAALTDNTVAATGAARDLAGTWQQVLAGAQGAMMAAGRAMAATERARQAQQAINRSRPTSFGGSLGAAPGDFPVSGIPFDPTEFVNQQFPVIGSPLTAGATGSSRGGRGGKRGGGGRGGSASEIDREREALEKFIEQLEFERSLIGLTDLEREKANALRRAGASASAEQRAQIEALITATHNETAAIEANQEAMRNLKALSKDVLGGIFEDLRDDASAADILANALNRIAESLVRVGIDQFIEGAFSGGGGARGGLFGGRIIPGILHGGGIAGVDGYGHGRSVSAAIFANAKRYHSGGTVLMPGEVPAILQRGETVLPRGSGATVVELRMSPDVEARVLRRAEGSSVRITEAGMRQVERRVPGLMLEAQKRVG